jgi:GT2 family glycosyltransferase
VDDASTDGTFETVKEQFPEIKVLRNNVEQFPSACRNIGIKNSQGSYIFFVDDDNVLDKNTIRELVEIFTKYKEVGLAGPLAFYYKEPRKIWFAGGKFNPPMFIIRSIWQGDVPNAFMIKREITKFVGFFDERFPIGFEEADFALRIQKKGYRIVVSTTAKIFHDVPTNRDFHVTKNRAYWRGRNRVVFYRKHVPARCFFLFVDALGFAILLLELKENMRKFLQYVKGIKDGLAFPLYSQM